MRLARKYVANCSHFLQISIQITPTRSFFHIAPQPPIYLPLALADWSSAWTSFVDPEMRVWVTRCHAWPWTFENCERLSRWNLPGLNSRGSHKTNSHEMSWRICGIIISCNRSNSFVFIDNWNINRLSEATQVVLIGQGAGCQPLMNLLAHRGPGHLILLLLMGFISVNRI